MVDGFAVNGQARVNGLGKLDENLLPGIVQINTNDVAPRDHDVVNLALLEIEDIDQHALVVVGDFTAFLDQGSQFLEVQPLQRFDISLEAEGLEDHVGEAVDQPDDRREDLEQNDEHIGGRKGDFFRMKRCHGFRGDFGEDEYDDGHCQGRDPDAAVTQKADADDRSDRRREDVDEVVAQQDEADQPVGLSQQVLCNFRTAGSAVRQVAQPVTIQGHQTCFRARKKAGEQQKYDQNGV